MMRTHEIEVKIVFFFPFILILLLFCNGCFTWETTKFCGRMHNEIHILERHGELSNDGQHLTVHIKNKRIIVAIHSKSGEEVLSKNQLISIP